MNDSAASSLPVAIREMSSHDLPRMVELEAQIFPDPWPVTAFQDVLAEENWHGLVAELEGELIAYACYLVAAQECHLANIAVVEPYRRKSVAKQLLDHILTGASKLRCQVVLLEVRVSNQQAIKFYEKHGFNTTYRRPGYYHSPKEDALIMSRPLLSPASAG